MKYILIIGDGMADNAIPSLNNKTPLQAAQKPFIDNLAVQGVVGQVKNVPQGLPPGSDTAILSIFGCDPNIYFTGRAPLEAAAAGLHLSAGDVAYRCNMVSYEDADLPMEEKRILSHSAGSIEGGDSIALIKALWADPTFSSMAQKANLVIHPDASFRHIAVQRNANVQNIQLIPPHDHLGEPVGALLPSGCANASVLKALMMQAHAFLDHHPINERRRSEGKLPANGVWFWAEGTAVALPDFNDRYHQSGGVISAVPLCHGIASLTGLTPITVEGATGELDTNYEGKVDAAICCLQDNDFVAIHIEAPDECTHNGDLDGKLTAIARLDSRVTAPLVKHMNGQEFRMLIVSDHKTLTATRGHDGDPVPFLLYDSRRDTKARAVYDEETGAQGPFIPAGTALMGILFEQETAYGI